MPMADFRTLVHRGARASFALLAATFATGCTAGEVTYSGRSIKQVSNATYYVSFHNATGVQRIQDVPGAQVSWNNPKFAGTATFSLDPTGPASEPYTPNPGVTNTSTSIANGNYVAELIIRTNGSSGDMVTFESAAFTQTYPTTTQTDSFTGQPITTQLYDFVLYPKQTGCPAASNNGVYVTVPLCQTDSVSGWALSATSGKY